MMKVLSWFLNKNFIMKYLDGYKTQIAGIVVGLAFVIDSLVGLGLLPPELTALLINLSEILKQVAGYFGVVGGLGKVAKAGS